MDNNLPKATMDKLTKTCTCKNISRAAIKKAIQKGCASLEEIQQATGAGSGACAGKNCGPRIEALLKQQ